VELSSLSAKPALHELHRALPVARLTSVQLLQLANVSVLHAATDINLISSSSGGGIAVIFL